MNTTTQSKLFGNCMVTYETDPRQGYVAHLILPWCYYVNIEMGPNEGNAEEKIKSLRFKLLGPASHFFELFKAGAIAEKKFIVIFPEETADDIFESFIEGIENAQKANVRATEKINSPTKISLWQKFLQMIKKLLR